MPPTTFERNFGVFLKTKNADGISPEQFKVLIKKFWSKEGELTKMMPPDPDGPGPK